MRAHFTSGSAANAQKCDIRPANGAIPFAMQTLVLLRSRFFHASRILVPKIRQRRAILPEAERFQSTQESGRANGAAVIKRPHSRPGRFKPVQPVLSGRHSRVEAVVPPRFSANPPCREVVPPRLTREPVAVANSVVHALACPLKPVPLTCRRLKDNRTVPADYTASG